MSDTFLQQGLDLMIYGMGTVIVFLTLLVVATGFMSRFIVRYFPDPVEPVVENNSKPPAGGVDPKIARIIAAALQQHREKHR